MFFTLFACLLILPGKSQAGEANRHGDHSKIDLITIPESRPQLLAVISPVLGRLRDGDNQPLLLSTSSSPRPETLALIKNLERKNPLVISRSWKLDPPRFSLPQNTNFLEISPDYSRFSNRVARKFWQRSDQAVLVSKKDQESMILGSALAGHLEAPLIIYDTTNNNNAVQQTLNDLQVEHVFLAMGKNSHRNHWTNRLNQEIEHLDADTLEKRLTVEVGKEEINVVTLTRLPEDASRRDKASAWLAPYYSIVRDSPVVMSNSADAGEAAEKTKNLIEGNNLNPRSVTILGDKEAIGQRTVEIYEDPDKGPRKEDRKQPDVKDDQVKYRIDVEPCMPVNMEEIPSFEVGRIPFSTVEEACTFLTRGFVRDQVLEDTESKAMMAANAAAGTRGLPLSETMARLSAEEFKNTGLTINAFYGDSVSSDEAAESALRANLVIYHGHTGHEDFLPESLDTSMGDTDSIDGQHPREQQHQEIDGYYPDQHDIPSPEITHEPYEHAPARQEIVKPSPEKAGEIPPEQLEGLPLVILQSCSSLGERFLDRIHPFGGAAKIGTVSAMHSASGTAIIKTLTDSVLYNDATLGESLRNARIYFFLMQKLKYSRDHTEQPKTQRAALSFQLWGDPELKVFPHAPDKPRQEPAEIEFTDSGSLRLSIDAVDEIKIETDDYFADFYPKAQVAGIVKRTGEDEPRRVAPIHFLQKELPSTRETKSSGRLEVKNVDSAEAFYSIDRMHDQLYVLFYPEKRYHTEEEYLLQFPEGDKN